MAALQLPGDVPFVNACVVVGAGLGHGLPDWQGLRPRRLVLIEPAADAAAHLRHILRDDPKAEVWHTAISDDLQAQLHGFDYPALSALSPARPQLLALFPGVTAQDPQPVPVVTPAQMMTRLALSADTAHVLVIEMPALALPLLQALDQINMLTRFRTIRLRGSETPLYENEASFTEVAEWLAARGYQAARVIDRADPDRPVLTVSFDVLGDLHARLAAAQEALVPFDGYDARHTANQLAQAEQDLARVTDDLAALTTRYQALHSDHQALVKAVKAHLAKART